MRIVFIHLNSQLPKYLEENIRYCKEVFSKNEIVLIHNQSHIKANLLGVNVFQYSPDSRWQQLESLYSHDKEFRNNFWLTSTARFFALEEFMAGHAGALLHVESDVLLSADFPFGKLEKIPCDLAFPIISNIRGVASTLFVRNIEAARLLTSNILDEVRKDPLTTEMIMLKKLYDANRNSIMPLPIGPNVTSAFSREATDLFSSWTNIYGLLGGIVDGVDIGQYFFGTDPRNRRGKVLIRTNLVNGFAKIEDWKLTFNEDRLFVDVGVEGREETYKVFSLHLPVKSRRLFDHSKQSVLFAEYAGKSNSKQGMFLIPSILIKAIWKSVLRKSKKTVGKKRKS